MKGNSDSNGNIPLEDNFLEMNIERLEQADENPTVLVVDDSPFNIVALRSLLSLFSLESDCASDGNEAIQLVKNRMSSETPMYKLILLDYSMPECDGPTATVEIRRLLGGVGTAPIQPFICCVTAYTGESFK